MSIKVVASNRRAGFEFSLLERFEAGLVLLGSEIKSIRAGHISIAEAYVQIDNMEAWMYGSHIAPYESANRFNHDPLRPRKLLLTRKEIFKLFQAVRQKGMTIVPVKVYLKDGLAKIEIALAKGKKLYDKRQDIAARDYQREVERRERLR